MSILYGGPLATCILENLKIQIIQQSKKPCFAIIQVGNNQASSLYINFKRKKAFEIGIESRFFHFKNTVEYDALRAQIIALNEDVDVHGIIIQLPLEERLKSIAHYIAPEKDIDGLTIFQQGNLFQGNVGLFPCTAFGVIQLLQFYNIDMFSKKIAVIGRSSLVGKPLAMLLLQQDAQVSIFHSKIREEQMEADLQSYDIICSAVGKKHFIKPDWIKPGSVLIDIGVYKDENGTFGDFDPLCYEKCSAYTPSTGGVGPVTVACLLKNVVDAFQFQSCK